MKNKKIALLMVISLSMIILAACTKDTKKIQDSINTVDNTSRADSSVSTNETTANKNIQETNTTNIVTKIEGRREEFLGRLDSIQKQLDDLPEKKDSDAGITNAMRSYYGESYDMYDEALNEIYSLLKEKLSQDTMKNLQTEEIKWIAQKEETANKEASQYKGGTFELVAYNMSLYESTKNRCYELVNNYMTDSKIKINASKQDYINKLDNIENEILLSPEYKNAATGITHNMLVLTDKEYNEWDVALNEIYNLLKQQLPSDEMKKLDQEEAQWIIQKENKAKKSEDPQGVGSQLGNIAYQASLAHTTQSRCYELAYRYMK
ncbi:lysozyme inhibitor LprI family protein [Clostridium sp.]|uniref:lysozyme inhibitor LprI family protein n=1 Tax=Clostridium sp. TaxID=1506 RepID=UPI00284395F9|nr:lysozyme inhibitor LprI family protein [Clostridium sp.]MDR3594215.1 DUF1311 domain-containing protein [Clostridium sp.]